MTPATPLLELEAFTLAVAADGGHRPIVRGIDLAVAEGEALGLVGESGSGKSMTSRAVVGLLPRGARTGGELRVAGRSVLALRGEALRRHRAHDVAMIFQDPRAHLNPIRTIGAFMIDGAVKAGALDRVSAVSRARTLLADVGIGDVDRRLRQYPHELSGGLLQRVMIATALMAEPRLLLADEPTTALDVTTQEEVMAILDELRRDRGLSLVFITHDLDLAAAVCDRLAVMRDGTIVETLPADHLYDHAADPYTRELLAARVPFDDGEGA